MRLERLDVGGFGALHGFDIEFHPRLTVIVGENESGKSTVQRALRAALYGLDAGGPGRPTERSEWSRWTPWNAAVYSLALTYALRDGRRFRLARRLESRDHTCQVQELGSGDVTDSLRVGRGVLPGEVHLGIDEAVFCASACVGDDGLRLGSVDTPASRADRVQEAIERLADSGSATTATEALAVLAQAGRRVGSERRLTSPLGYAVNRLRQLDVQLDDARRRSSVLAAEEERLRALEREATAAEHRRADAERRWLVGRLAAIAAQVEDIAAGTAEMVHLAAEIEGNGHLASFPVESEERVVAVAAELREAQRSADEADARASAAEAPLAHVRRRRREILAGVTALGEPPAVTADGDAAVVALREELSDAVAGRRQGDEIDASKTRRDALRREIAATGLAHLSAAEVEHAATLVALARGTRGRRWPQRLGAVVLLVGAAVAGLAATSTRYALAVVAAVVATAAWLAVTGAGRLTASEGARALRGLRLVLRSVPLDDQALERLAQRLPQLRALHAELQREEVRIETLARGVDSAEARLRDLAVRAEALAAAAGIRTAPDDGAEARVRAVLAAFDRAQTIERRQAELAAEDAVLAEREGSLEEILAEARDRAAGGAEVRRRLAWLLEPAGIDLSIPTTEAVARFRAGCDGRRRLAAALRRRDELDRRRHTTGDEHSLERLRSELETQLVARGGEPGDVGGARALTPGELQDLETEADHARQSAVVAATTAAQLRSRLGEMRATVPPLADLEDERAACVAARDRARRQLAALQRAAELVEMATRGVHRDLAPRLAASVADRLALLTEGRYSAVNVDTDHFAVSLLGRDRPDLVPLDLLSHGTRDQVSLLLRLALAEVLSGGGEPVPLLLDEPLMSADPQRRSTALRFLWNLSATNQVVLSTSDPTHIDCLEEVCDGERPGVVRMPSPAMVFEAVGRATAPARVL